MSYIFLQHTQFSVGPVFVNSAIPFEEGIKSGNIQFDGQNITIREPGVYVAHWHIPARFVELLGIAPGIDDGDGLVDRFINSGQKRNILISLTKNGKIIGRSVTNVDERRNLDLNLTQEFSEIVSGVAIFKVKAGDNIALKNHSFRAIEVPSQSNSSACPICAGGSFAIYKIDECHSCDDDDDNDCECDCGSGC